MKLKFEHIQSGSALIEAMIAILIFSFGVLGIIGLQAVAISGTAEAKYRNEAGFFANRLLGEMATANRTQLADLAPFQSAGPGASYTAWYNDIQNATVGNGLLGLPGASTNAPIVTIVAGPNNASGKPTSYDVTITVPWQSPGQPQHRHVTTASISAD
jgi:type IV pilus assembly protein PilV